MPDPTTQEPAFCLVLHDVAPSTWKSYNDFITAIDALNNIPLTLLVVPDYHREGTLDHFPSFISEINRRLEKGDEVVLHGYYHDDPGPVGPSPKEWFMRRIFTHEGEFYRLTESEARHRLKLGTELFANLGWPVKGFVPPAWLLGEQARQALKHYPFSYISNIHGLEQLQPKHKHIAVPTLVWSSRSTWRRKLSRIWNDQLLKRHDNAPLIRLGLHPIDMQTDSVKDYWLEIVNRLSGVRRPVTKSAWLEKFAV